MKYKKTNKFSDYIEWIFTHKIITFISTIMLFTIPLIVVHILFKWNSDIEWIQAEWEAGDIISYIAGFEAFIGTTFLSFLALWQNQKHKMENDQKDKMLLDIENEKIRLSNLPQFLIQTADYNKAIDPNFSIPSQNGNIVALDYIKTHGFFINSSGKYWIPAGRHPGIERKSLTNFNAIINCGNNTAHQVKLIMTIDGVEYKDEKSLSMKKDDEIYLYIGIDNSISFESDMILTIRYFDCFQNVYEQKFIVKNNSEYMSLISYSDTELIKRNSSMEFVLDE